MSSNYSRNILNSTMSNLSYRNMLNSTMSNLNDTLNNVVKNVFGYYTVSDMLKSKTHEFLILNPEMKKKYVRNILGFTAITGLISAPTSLAVGATVSDLIDTQISKTLSECADKIGLSMIGNKIRGYDECDKKILPYICELPMVSRVLQNVKNVAMSCEYTNHKYCVSEVSYIKESTDVESDFVLLDLMVDGDIEYPISQQLIDHSKLDNSNGSVVCQR